MSFWKQSELTIVVGLLLMVPMAFVYWLAFPTAPISPIQEAVLLACLSTFLVGMVVCMLALMRIWHRFADRVLVSTHIREIAVRHPMYRWLAWVDERGEDRDRNA